MGERQPVRNTGRYHISVTDIEKIIQLYVMINIAIKILYHMFENSIQRFSLYKYVSSYDVILKSF